MVKLVSFLLYQIDVKERISDIILSWHTLYLSLCPFFLVVQHNPTNPKKQTANNCLWFSVFHRQMMDKKFLSGVVTVCKHSTGGALSHSRTCVDCVKYFIVTPLDYCSFRKREHFLLTWVTLRLSTVSMHKVAKNATIMTVKCGETFP